MFKKFKVPIFQFEFLKGRKITDQVKICLEKQI